MRDSLSYEKIVTVAALPAPSATYQGAFAQQSADGHLYWCDGSAWLDVAYTVELAARLLAEWGGYSLQYHLPLVGASNSMYIPAALN